MKKATLFATVLVAGFGASHVEAQALKGSDTLEAVTNNIIANCPAATGISYLGGGTGAGENAMAASPATQQIAPMSRKVTCARAGAFPTSQGKILGYDGIGIAASSCNGEAAGSLCQAYSAGAAVNGYVWAGGTDNGAYPVACDKLRVLYFGRDHNNVTDCNSALRQALVNTWGNLFEGAQSGTCTQLSHAFRRDDLSGTTDTLRGVCGLPSSTAFCNGTAAQDNDPIRRPAPSANYDIARADGTLGVVLPIAVPPSANAYTDGVPSTDTCGAGGVATQGGTRCPTGVFAFRSYPGFANCPGGRPRRGGLCLIPVVSATNPRCINSQTNLPPASAAGTDGRIFNTQPRNPDGTIVSGLTSAFYRLHESRTVVGGGCKQTDATQQIGCLVRADKCAEGYAGREVLAEPAIATVQLASAGGVCTSPNAGTIVGGTYPLSRKLYLSSLKGFGAVTGEEADLSACFSDEAKVESAISANNFIPDPLAGIQTENFSAANCF